MLVEDFGALPVDTLTGTNLDDWVCDKICKSRWLVDPPE